MKKDREDAHRILGPRRFICVICGRSSPDRGKPSSMEDLRILFACLLSVFICVICGCISPIPAPPSPAFATNICEKGRIAAEGVVVGRRRFTR
jgi:hypothetical protein